MVIYSRWLEPSLLIFFFPSFLPSFSPVLGVLNTLNKVSTIKTSRISLFASLIVELSFCAPAFHHFPLLLCQHSKAPRARTALAASLIYLTLVTHALINVATIVSFCNLSEPHLLLTYIYSTSSANQPPCRLLQSATSRPSLRHPKGRLRRSI